MAYIILDRDGVINYDSELYIKHPDEWIPIPGSLDAIAQLNRFGYQVLVATNQSGIAKGLYDFAMLDSIHEKLKDELASVGGFVDEIFVCPHQPCDACMCRKPQPGLLKQIASKYPLDLSKTFFIGDSYRDIEAGLAVGCLPLLVLTGNGAKTLEQNPTLKQDIPYFPDLARAVDYVLDQRKYPHG